MYPLLKPCCLPLSPLSALWVTLSLRVEPVYYNSVDEEPHEGVRRRSATTTSKYERWRRGLGNGPVAASVVGVTTWIAGAEEVTDRSLWDIHVLKTCRRGPARAWEEETACVEDVVIGAMMALRWSKWLGSYFFLLIKKNIEVIDEENLERTMSVKEIEVMRRTEVALYAFKQLGCHAGQGQRCAEKTIANMASTRIKDPLSWPQLSLGTG